MCQVYKSMAILVNLLGCQTIPRGQCQDIFIAPEHIPHTLAQFNPAIPMLGSADRLSEPSHECWPQMPHACSCKSADPCLPFHL